MKKSSNNIKKLIQLSLAVLVASGCQSVSIKNSDEMVKVNQDTSVVEQEASMGPKPLKSVPKVVRNELLQQESSKARRTLLSEKQFSIGVNKLAAKEFFAGLVADSSYGIVVHPDVKGEITMNIKDVTLDEALNVTESLYGYDIKREGRIIKVFPAGVRTETIALDYLFIKRRGSSSTNISSGGVSENDPNSGQNGSSGNGNSGGNRGNNSGGSGGNGGNGGNGSNGGNNGNNGINIFTESESDFWTEFAKTLKTLIGDKPNRSVVVSPHAGLVTVRALPSEINEVREFIQYTEEHLRRQVVIETKIMEVTLNDDFKQGIEWSNVIGHIESTDVSFATNGTIEDNAISASIGGLTGISFRNADFTNVIRLLSTQGNVQVLSSPRITATNNQKAVIKVGEDEYFVTEVSSTTTTGTSTTTTPEISLTPFFSGIALDVTPQINKSGEVILHVHPSVTLTDEQIKVITVGDDAYSLPLAQSSVRESDTIIKAQSGEIVVIGGLIESRKVDQESKTPLLGDIPFMGELFKSKSKAEQKRELVIMLKPIVIDNNQSWKSQLQGARSLLKKWFPEDLDANTSSN